MSRGQLFYRLEASIGLWDTVLPDQLFPDFPMVSDPRTSVIVGPVNMNVYSKGREQQEMGIIGNGSLCPPGSALVKLHHLLSVSGKEGVPGGWERDLVGENPPFSRE